VREPEAALGAVRIDVDVVDTLVVHAVLRCPDQDRLLQRHRAEQHVEQPHRPVGRVGAVRPHAVIATGDRDTREREEQPEEHPGRDAVTMDDAVPRHDRQRDQWRHREDERRDRVIRGVLVSPRGGVIHELGYRWGLRAAVVYPSAPGDAEFPRPKGSAGLETPRRRVQTLPSRGPDPRYGDDLALPVPGGEGPRGLLERARRLLVAATQQPARVSPDQPTGLLAAPRRQIAVPTPLEGQSDRGKKVSGVGRGVDRGLRRDSRGWSRAPRPRRRSRKSW
jgi:hypothetical protein